MHYNAMFYLKHSLNLKKRKEKNRKPMMAFLKHELKVGKILKSQFFFNLIFLCFIYRVWIKFHYSYAHPV